MDIEIYMQRVGKNARAASRQMAMSGTAKKNQALLAIAKTLDSERGALLIANEADLERGRKNNLEAALLDRLELTHDRIDAMLEGLEQVAALADPVGQITDMSYRPSGIQVGKMRVPLGVVGIVYESRPNVTMEAASLCIKSGNAAILRGGSEAISSNRAMAGCIERGLQGSELPVKAVQVIETPDRAAVGKLITMSEFVDVIIPRGGKGLIERISREARVPVIKHLDGVCHVFIDAQADLDKAHRIAVNAKTNRYGVCNAMETLLVAEAVAKVILPGLAKAYAEAGVVMRACDKAKNIIDAAGFACEPAAESDWYEEYLAPILAIRVVADADQAIEHIATYGSQHTDAIVTENYTVGRRFLSQVDSSSVMINASTRFADGFEYGLGAEIGISTDKIHARGPVGLEGLTSQKYIVLGDGHIRG